MPTRQYIGARYVPKIFDNNGSSDWVSGIAYEPLTIVTYMNNSYTSKKPVPSSVGNPADNANYWANTGNYTGVISDLADRVTAVEGDIVDINDKLDSLDNRYFIFQGDSYSDSTYVGGNTWIDDVVFNLGLTSNDYTALRNSGGGFDNEGVHGTFLQQLQDTTISGHTVTDANDWNSVGSVLGTAIVNYINYARTTYPSAKIWLAMIGNSKTLNYANGMMNISYKYYKETAIQKGANWMESPTNVLAFGSQMADEVHPNVSGSTKLGIAITNELLGLSTTPTDDLNNYAITKSSAFSSGDNAHMTLRHRGDMIELQFEGVYNGSCRLNYAEASTLPTSPTEIFKINDSIVGNNYIQFCVPITVVDNSSNVKVIPAVFRFIGDTMYMNVNATYANITTIVIPNNIVTAVLRKTSAY